MKNKTIAILLTTVLTIAATACGNTPADAVPAPTDIEEQSASVESSGEGSDEESTEESVEEESIEDGASEEGKSFTYMMDDGWYEPYKGDFDGLWYYVGEAVLNLERGDKENYEKLQEWAKGDVVMSDLVQRWEKDSFESQGSYTWEQFAYDIYKEYNIPMPDKRMCRIDDSYYKYTFDFETRNTETVECVLNNWYDRFVVDEDAEYLEELAKRVGIDTTSDEFCGIFRRMWHSAVSENGVSEPFGDEILARCGFGEEKSAGDGVPETETGKSFAYMMDDGWYEPGYSDFYVLWNEVGVAALDLMPGLDAYYKVLEWDKEREVMSDFVRRWEEDSYEGQGSYTWEQFEHDIYIDYNVRIQDLLKCKIGDSYWYTIDSDVFVLGEPDNRDWVEWVVDDWYDRYVYDSAAKYFEELAERVGIDTTSDEFCRIFRRFLNTCINDWEQGVEPDEEQEILAEFGIE